MQDAVNIHQLMVEFHKKFRPPKKTGFNPHFRQPYFKLEDLNGAITPLANELGMYVTHHLSDGGLQTSIIADGQTLISTFPIPNGNNPQVMGSWLTYGMRYNLCALFNIAENDDDGEAAAINSPKLATDEQWATINDYIESGNPFLDEERLEYLETHKDSLLEADAARLIEKMKEADND